MYLIIFSFWISGTQKTGLISGLTSTKSLANPSPHVPQTQQHTPQQSPISTPTTTSAPPLRPPLSPSRPKCNSVLHLFGTWLFEAALVGSDMTSFTSSSDRKFFNTFNCLFYMQKFEIFTWCACLFLYCIQGSYWHMSKLNLELQKEWAPSGHRLRLNLSLPHF